MGRALEISIHLTRLPKLHVEALTTKKSTTEEVERVMLASSFIFGGKGYIRLQKTNIKDEYRPFFFKFARHSAMSMIYPNAAKWLPSVRRNLAI